MIKDIVVDTHPYQTRAALLEDGELVELYIERRHKSCLVGNIYKGRVQNVLPGMQAAFVDIGMDKNAFLFMGDTHVDAASFEFGNVHGTRSPQADVATPNIGDMLHAGQELMVQVVKEPVGSKSARITIHITLPGRLLVLMPTVNYVGVSRRIEGEEERTRLKELLERIKPSDVGVIVRTCGAGEGEEAFVRELEWLVRLWEEFSARYRGTSAPRLLHMENDLLQRTIRDIFTEDVRRLVVGEKGAYLRAKAMVQASLPELADRVEHYDGEDVFDHFGIESRIEKSLHRKTWLKNGAYLVFDQTEAMTTVDVNTGKYVGNRNLQETILNTNLEAAKEIAKQLRLRDISGIIIIDFIDMMVMEHREKVVETLRECLRRDRTKTNVLGITNLGLVEMTRRKLRQQVSDVLQCTCPTCNGVGRVYSPESMALRLRKKVARHMAQTDYKYLVAEANTAVIDCVLCVEAEGPGFIPRSPGRVLYLLGRDNMRQEKVQVRGEHTLKNLLEHYPEAVLF